MSVLVLLLPVLATSAMAQDATPNPVASPHPFAGDPAWIAYYGPDGIGLIHPDGTDDHQVDTGVPGAQLLPN